MNIFHLIVDNRLGDKSCCWLCTGVPDNILTFEDHHIVPRSLGGTNGPLVFLCADCHTNVHKCAKKLLVGKSFVPYRKALEKDKCLSLAQVIVKATLEIEKNPVNKIFVFSGILDYDTHQKLTALTEYYSIKNKRISQLEIVKLAISNLYQKVY